MLFDPVEFEIPTERLKEAAAKVGRVVPKQHFHPALTGLGLEVGDGQMRLVGAASWGEIEVSLEVECPGAEQAWLPGAFFKAVERLPEEQTRVRLDGEGLHLKSGGFACRILKGELKEPRFQPPEGYPLSVDAGALLEGLRRVLHAAEGGRMISTMTGAIWLNGSEIVATNGYLLAHYRTSLELPEEVALPLEGAREILRVFPREGTLALAVEKGRVVLAGGGCALAVQRADKVLPPYQRFLSAEAPLSARMDGPELEAALQRVALLVRGEAVPRVDLEFTPEEVRLRVEGELGRGEEALPGQVEGGEALRVPYNTKLLAEALKGVEGEVTLRVHPSGPNRIEQGGYTAVLVPLRVA